MEITTVGQLADFIEEATQGAPGLFEGKRDYIAEAHWFVAFSIAECMREDYTTKDWAHYVKEGMQPQTDEDVEDWLDADGSTREEFRAEVRRFYGLK